MNFQHDVPARQRSSTTPKTPTTPDIFHSSEYKPRLFEEIALLMRASGDAILGQNREAIILVEKILVDQLRGILSEAMNVAFKRTGSFIPSQCDFEYLMRKNPPKAQRLRKYMKTPSYLKAEQTPSFQSNFYNRLAEETVSDEEQEIYDPDKMRRLFRADRISQTLSTELYNEWNKARTWSSSKKNKSDMLRKLVEILQIPKDVQENSNCLEILLFLTQETICTLVDYAILTRLNSSNHITESLVISSSITNSMLHLCPEVSQGRPTMDGIKAITVQEIHEAIRRVQTMSSKRMGTSFRSSELKTPPFLAL